MWKTCRATPPRTSPTKSPRLIASMWAAATRSFSCRSCAAPVPTGPSSIRCAPARRISASPQARSSRHSTSATSSSWTARTKPPISPITQDWAWLISTWSPTIMQRPWVTPHNAFSTGMVPISVSSLLYQPAGPARQGWQNPVAVMMRIVGPSPIRHRRGVSGLICLSSGINHTAMWLGTSPNVNTCVHQHGKICRNRPAHEMPAGPIRHLSAVPGQAWP